MEKLIDSKECFGCKKLLPLNDFENASKFVLKCDLGKVRVCILCDYKRALETLSLVDYNKNLGKYEVFKFSSKNEVTNYFRNVKQVLLSSNFIEKF